MPHGHGGVIKLKGHLLGPLITAVRVKSRDNSAQRHRHRQATAVHERRPLSGFSERRLASNTI
eukprot:6114397-Prymnesium_polylepis.1